MKISTEELQTGFWHAGTVYPDDVATLRVEINRDAHGFVVYIMNIAILAGARVPRVESPVQCS
jgi:hypothetical protein